MPNPTAETDSPSRRAQILAAGTALMHEGGLPALTFDAIAERLGVSKQAILYWFPKKTLLVEALVLESIQAETTAARAALAEADKAAPERAFIDAVARFHLADLDRFRLIYLVPQTGRASRAEESATQKKTGRAATGRSGDSEPFPPDAVVPESVHQASSDMYAALAAALARARDLPADAARRRAVVLHTSVLGLITLVALADAIDDPLLHGTEDLVASLTAMVAADRGEPTV